MCLLVVNLFIDIVFFSDTFSPIRTYTLIPTYPQLMTCLWKQKNKTKHVFIKKKFSFQTPNKRNKFVNIHTNVFSTPTSIIYLQALISLRSDATMGALTQPGNKIWFEDTNALKYTYTFLLLHMVISTCNNMLAHIMETNACMYKWSC